MAGWCAGEGEVGRKTTPAGEKASPAGVADTVVEQPIAGCGACVSSHRSY